MALAPWPNAGTQARTAAIAKLKEVIGNLSDERLNDLGMTAAALVERYAPGAPGEIKNEAVVRTAGWLAEQPHAAIRSEETGEISTSYNPASLSALRHSGAMALLSPWKIRRAGAI